jgi:hypothetical protein
MLEKTSELPSFNDVQEKPFATIKEQDFSLLWEDNVFSPFRLAEEGDTFSSLKVTGFELIGVCKYGDISAAVIVDKNASTTGGGQIGQHKAGASETQPQFYKLNDIFSNGFVLKEINSDSVTLVRGKEQIILQIEFEDDGTLKRTKATVPLETEKPSSQIKTGNALEKIGDKETKVEKPNEPNKSMPIPPSPVPPPVRPSMPLRLSPGQVTQ